MTTTMKSGSTVKSERLRAEEEAEGIDAPDTKPTAVELIGPIYSVLAKVVVLSRLGFTISIDHAPAVFAATGAAAVVMVPGDPQRESIEVAKQAMEEALSREQYVTLDAEKRAAAAEQERMEQATRAAARAVIEAQIAAQQESLRQLQATLTAV